MAEFTEIEKKGHVYILRLNRPEKLNALNPGLIQELEDTVSALNMDKNCKVLIITGAGRAFCAGADIGGHSDSQITPQERTLASSRAFKRLFRAIEYARPFTIAAINGYALGGGLEMALSCDIRVAAASAKMGLVEPAIGSFPGGGGNLRLPRLIGLGKAKEMLALAEKVTADRAYELGMVEHVVPPETLLDYCLELGARIAKNSTTAIAGGKLIMTMGVEMDIDRAGELEAALLGVYADSHDRREGRKAFAEKRPPQFE